MINKLRHKLILLYTCSTGIILTAVLILTLTVSYQQILRNKKESFQNNYGTVTQKLMMSNEISQLWLSEMEMENRLIISIEDCGKALMYRGAWQNKTKREELVEKVKELARRDGVDIAIRPVSTNEIQSKLYQIRGNEQERYYGRAFIISTKAGYRSVILLQYISGQFILPLKQNLLIILLYLSGMIALYLVSRWIVGKSLKPVEESRRRQTEFVASASHELKSPLAVIRANASALIVDPEKAGHFSKGIDRECMRMSALIEDLLILASADSKRWTLKKEIIDMELLLTEILDTFRPYCMENHKDLELMLQEELLPQLEGDSLRIKQILSILLDNAVTYSVDGDTILLRAYVKKNHLIFEVEDHGKGINPDMKKDIFERFYRGDKSRKDKNHFGLGLCIAKELTELHGGRIVLGDTTGGGATFSVSLPICKAKNDSNR